MRRRNTILSVNSGKPLTDLICMMMLIASLISLSGCAKVMNIKKLLRIKGYSDNKDMQEKHVHLNDKNFELLMEAVNQDRMGGYPDKKSILKAFGDPIFSTDDDKEGQIREKWLYRYAMKYFDSEKVYLYFDDEEKLVDWKYVEPPKQKEE